jgi:diaminopimelate epimerase
MTPAAFFIKVEGLGNDFILFDGLDGRLPVERLEQPDLVRRLCDRHTGIGADGILLLLPAEDPGSAHARMRILNSDGSEAEMCGNGIRCAAKILHDGHPELASIRSFEIETGAGRRTCELDLHGCGAVVAVRVDMGAPDLERSSLPMVGTGQFIEQPIEAGGRRLLGTAVSLGNPHLVIFTGADEEPEALARSLGPLLERHPDFPRRTNVELARLGGEGGPIELWVWERGAGITRACGTGACATAVAAVATGRLAAGRPVEIHLPGGVLQVEVAPPLARVYMTGPAAEVFRGEVEI